MAGNTNTGWLVEVAVNVIVAVFAPADSLLHSGTLAKTRSSLEVEDMEPWFGETVSQLSLLDAVKVKASGPPALISK